MSQGDSMQKALELTVLNAEGLNRHRSRGYYVRCTVSSETRKTKSVKPMKEDWTVEWKEKFSFNVDDKAKLLLQVMLDNLVLRDEEEGRSEISVKDLRYDDDVKYKLVNLNGKRSNPANQSISIRCRRVDSSAAVQRVVQDTSKAAQPERIASRSDKLDKAEAIGSTGKEVTSAAESWEFLVTNIEFLNGLVTALSEIHPYVKAALSIVTGITEVFIAQIKRDDKIVDLISTMNDTYDFIHEGEYLNNVERYKPFFMTMAMQTIECGYFIQAYVRDGFFKRSVKSLNPRIDKAINDFQIQFTKLRDSFASHSSLDTTIQVYRIMDAVQNLSATINLDEITYAEGMRFNLEACCLPETRKDILDNIIRWANDTGSESRVLLLTGLAGSGKSSIAHSLASHFNGLNRLGSSFFCTRANLANSRPDKVFCTIARDIADQNGQVLEKLTEIVRMHKSLSTTRSVREQFRGFIKETSEGLTMVGPLVVVIDALDECEGDDGLRRELMRILAEETSSLPKQFRFFLTARSSDIDVETAFRDAQGVERIYLEKADRKSTDGDIFLFVGIELRNEAADLTQFDANWQQNLTRQSGGLFIWASTACRFIRGERRSGGTRPRERFKQLQERKISSDVSGGSKALKGVYELYTAVLTSAFDPEDSLVVERFRTVLGIVISTFAPLSTSAVDELLGQKEEGLAGIIIPELGSLLIGWDDTKTPVQVLHASFSDYLTITNPNGPFHIDNTYRHLHLALICLQLMNKELRVNMCRFEDTYTLYEDMPSGTRVKQRQEHLSEALQYACRYWAMHIVQLDAVHYNTIKEALHQFLFGGKHLMQWVEVVGITDSMDTAKRSMRALLEWCKVIKGIEPRIHRLVYDCCRFLEVFSYQITLGPLHTYLSALPYVPTETSLFQLYQGISGLEPHVIFGRDDRWSLRRSYLQTDGECLASAFSPDGTLVACVSNNGEIQVFDFATSALLSYGMRLDIEEKTELYFVATAFSPDGSKIAVSHPQGVEIWDIKNRERLLCNTDFRTHEKKIPIAFRSNDCLVACRPDGANVELWSYDLKSRKSTSSVKSIDGEIKCAAMSPNGFYAGCVSLKSRVSVWDANSQAEVAHFNLEDDENEVQAMGISSDGIYITVPNKNGIMMWSRTAQSVIWTKKAPWESISNLGKTLWGANAILMPLSTECKSFVARGESVCVWDMATGDCHKHESYGLIRALSTNGQFLVTSLDPVIYNVEVDVDQPVLDSSTNADERSEPQLLEDEELTHVAFSEDGSLIAGGRKENAVFVWKGLGTNGAAKQILEGHSVPVMQVKFSPDGRKAVSVDDDDNELVWARRDKDAKFELLESWELEDHGAVLDSLRELSKEVQGKTSTRSSEKPLFTYEQWSEWVTTAAEGRMLWRIPDDFVGFKSTQKGGSIIVYNSYRAVLFKYIIDSASHRSEAML